MNKKIGKQLKLLWQKVGLIVNLFQMVEYNLANILAFDEILREFYSKPEIASILPQIEADVEASKMPVTAAVKKLLGAR